ncbi:DUF3850 domain-containing protein [Listeria monocytogenes]|nr:DUF3850 domain-containing protein [Listeria monocytogenes]ECB9798241.1 DUF3850 domain-containing protein [Listeria monocytogenes]CBY76125.1 hypothetical protein LMOSLCC2540_1484 [Listeria monocytogenes SLCC2540]HAC3260665.1 DUF3850 domain-containing protein [Listeria monocytogenes]
MGWNSARFCVLTKYRLIGNSIQSDAVFFMSKNPKKEVFKLKMLEKIPDSVVVHKLKIESCHFEDILNNGKRIETRYNDRNFRVGDLLRLCEIKNAVFTGREMLVVVDFVTKYYQLEGYVGMNFRIILHDGEEETC